MSKIESLHHRLKNIGISVEFIGNYPWIYLHKVNGNKVKERFYGNHGFTAFFLGVRTGELSCPDLKKLFITIRKYR